LHWRNGFCKGWGKRPLMEEKFKSASFGEDQSRPRRKVNAEGEGRLKKKTGGSLSDKVELAARGYAAE